MANSSISNYIYIKTKYPDLKPPIVDLNDIKIQATPTNPVAPNGETLFEMWLWIKDESDFAGKASNVLKKDDSLTLGTAKEYLWKVSTYCMRHSKQ